MKSLGLAAALCLTMAASPAAHAATNVSVSATIYNPPPYGMVAGSTIVKHLGDPTFQPALTTSVDGGGASAWASADLQTGTLRGYGSSLGTPLSANFRSGFQDSFSFNIDGANRDTVTIGYLAIDFEAEIRGGTGVTYFTAIGGSRSSINFVNWSSNPGNPPHIFTHSTVNPLESFNRDVAYSAPDRNTGFGSVSYLLPFELLGATPSIGFESFVQSTGNGYGLVDFANSAHMRFVLPQNVTFTSGSGVALTAVSGAVPEPSTWAMLIIGFGVVGAGMRRARRRQTIIAAA